MRRAALVLALSAVLVTAGCGSIGSGDGPTGSQTVTPVAVPDSGNTPDRTPDREFVAPGLTTDRVVDYTALIQHHSSVLSNTSHTYREQVTRRYANGTLRGEYTTVLRRNGSQARYQYTQSVSVRNPTASSVDRWATGNRTYTARTSGNETNRTVERDRTGSDVPFEYIDYDTSLGQLFRFLDIEVTGVERRNGTRLYQLQTSEPQVVPPTENASFVGYVTAEGLFTRYRLTYERAWADRRITVTIRVSFENVSSTTVNRPAWVDADGTLSTNQSAGESADESNA